MDNSAQITSWNGAVGAKWVRDADRLDAMLRPFADAVLSAAKLAAGERVTDIGCGAGALSLAAAGAGAVATGVDVSEPLIDLARRRAATYAPGTRFMVADASEWKPQEPAQVVISRFGVMFFADPAAAFANIRAGTKPSGRLVFACWRTFPENHWASAPVLVALPLLREPPAAPPPGTPGPFSFADDAHVRRILEQSGWRDIRLTLWDGLIELPGANAEDTAAFMVEIGPLGRTMLDQQVDPEPVRQALVDWLRKMSGETGHTRLKAAVWIVEATA